MGEATNCIKWMLVSLMENYVEDVRLWAVWQIYTDMTLYLTLHDVGDNNNKNIQVIQVSFPRETVLVDTIQSLVWVDWFNALLFLI